MNFTALVVLLIVLGLVLLVVELLVIPGFGVIGVLGIGSLVGATIVATRELGPASGALAFAIGVVLTALLFYVVPRTRVGREFVLASDQRGSRAAEPGREGLEGTHGVAVTPLRPAGSARFGDRVVDVVADGVYVEVGASIRVVKVEGARVVVEPVLVNQDETPAAGA